MTGASRQAWHSTEAFGEAGGKVLTERGVCVARSTPAGMRDGLHTGVEPRHRRAR